MAIKKKGGQDGEQDDDEGDEKRKHVLRQNVVNFFFTNFPPEWNKANLHDLFVEVGEIADVYVARKLTKAGKRFGFARFFRIGNLQALEKRLNRITIGSFRLKANVAKFEKSVSMSKQGLKKEGWVFDMASRSNHPTTCDQPSSTVHTGVHTTTDGESFKIHSPVELESIWLSMHATYCNVIHIGGSKFSLEFGNKLDEYTSGNDSEKGIEEEVSLSNDDRSNLVGGGLGSIPDKTDEPTVGHVKDGDTPTKDGIGESDGSYASTFPAQGCKKENSKFELDHVSPCTDKVEHVNNNSTSQGIEVGEMYLSSHLEGQVGSSKPRPTKKELEKIIAYSRWKDSIKDSCAKDDVQDSCEKDDVQLDDNDRKCCAKNETLPSQGEKAVTAIDDDCLGKKRSEKKEAVDSSTFPANDIERDILNLKSKLAQLAKDLQI